ncbi:MAG: DUF5693 family protein [Acidaminococcaceae bacterium]|nr:DUF5693 family protein [Acidaminococcaceae bacterium]
MKKFYNKILVLVILLGLCFALYLNWQRYEVERANTTVETVMEYGAIARLAHSEGISEEKALQLFKDQGVTTLALFDTTLDKLTHAGDISMVTGEELLHAQKLGQLSPQWQAIVLNDKFKSTAVYIAQGKSKRALQDVEEDISLRFGSQRINVLSQNPKILQVTGDLEMIKDNFSQGEQKGIREMDLGISSDELALAKKAGFMVMVRPVNYCFPYTNEAASSKKQIDALFARLDASGAKISSFVASGKSVLGFNKELPYVAQKLRERDITLGMVEGVTQLQFAPAEGLTDLAKLTNYQVARTYVIDKIEQKRMTVYDAFRRWALADEERNIRINYIKTFLTPRDGKTLLDTNVYYVGQVCRSVGEKGYTSGKAGVFRPYLSNVGLIIPLVFAVVAAWVIYAGLLFNLSDKNQYFLLLMGGILCSSVLFVQGYYTIMRLIIALGAATMLPVLSMNLVMQRWEKHRDEAKSLVGIIRIATAQLIAAVFCSLIGGAILAAILSDIRFLLEIDIYRGVKLTFLLPVVLMGVLFFKSHSLWQGDLVEQGIFKRIRKILAKPLTLKLLLGLGTLGFIAWVFIGRSGHTEGVPVPAIEMKMRLFLERAMYARPREKEFMIGHPAFYLAAYAVYKKLPNLFYLAFALLATIGQASLVQTFAHMRTPVIMSYVRAFDGLALGILLGIIAVVFFSLLYPYWQKLQRRMESDE